MQLKSTFMADLFLFIGTWTNNQEDDQKRVRLWRAWNFDGIWKVGRPFESPYSTIIIFHSATRYLWNYSDGFPIITFTTKNAKNNGCCENVLKIKLRKLRNLNNSSSRSNYCLTMMPGVGWCVWLVETTDTFTSGCGGWIGPLSVPTFSPLSTRWVQAWKIKMVQVYQRLV